MPLTFGTNPIPNFATLPIISGDFTAVMRPSTIASTTFAVAESRCFVSSSDVFDATRSQVGLTFHPVPSNDALACNLYFMVLHTISDGARDWSPLNIFGFEVAYAF